MRRVSIFGWVTMAIACLAATAHGEQQVKLQSGATLIGNVSMEGANLVVDIDGAKIQVPFKDVASVTSSKAGGSNQAEQLLFKGLEAQLLSEGEKEEIGLLAEAYRMAPENPHVAFWYARSLANAGNGKGASAVFEPHRETIAAAYPGIADQLSSQIEQRLMYEKLPTPLLKRLDKIAAAAEHANPIGAEKTAYAAFFRLVDQADEPIEKSAFRINCNGEDESLEPFSDGYYLFTFMRRNSYGDNPCRLEVVHPALVGEPVEFRGGVQGAEDVGVLRVKRLSDADRRPVLVQVVDPNGKPLSGAAVAFTMIGRSGSPESIRPVTTGADGKAKLNLFPNDYQCQVTRQGFSTFTQKTVVSPDKNQPIEVEPKLFPAITAAIKVVWRSKLGTHPGMPQPPGDAVTIGEFEQHIGPNANAARVGPFGPNWVRLVQEGDAVQLHFMEQMHFPHGASDATWVARWERAPGESDESEEDSAATAELFDILDLTQLDSVKNEIRLTRFNLGGQPGGGQPVSLPVEAGDIYMGRINSRDPQTGRPAAIEFKILATELFRP